MKHALALSLTLAAFWLLLSGHYTALLLSLGAASVLLTVWLAHRMDIVDHEGQPWHVGRHAPVYGIWLLGQALQSAWSVTRCIWSPRPVRPARGRTPAPALSELGLVIYANSITLTPGTLTLAVDDDAIEIHALDPASLEDLNDGDMLKHVRKLDAR